MTSPSLVGGVGGGVGYDPLTERRQLQVFGMLGDQIARRDAFSRRNSLESVSRGEVRDFNHNPERSWSFCGLVTSVTHVENYTVSQPDTCSLWYNVCMVTMFDTLTVTEVA